MEKKNSEAREIISCREAGRRGGTRTAATHGPDFYQKIGRKGGTRTRDLIQRGREAETVDS